MAYFNEEEALKGKTPYDFDKAKLYFGTTRQIFFSRKATNRDRDFVQNPNSILNQRYITASNGLKEEAKVYDEFRQDSHGLFMGFLQTAYFYASKFRDYKNNLNPIILMMEVPTDILYTILLEPGYEDDESDHDFMIARNNEDIAEIFKSRKQFAEHCNRTISRGIMDRSQHINEGFAPVDGIHFAIEREAPIDWIEAVWDLNISQQKEFIIRDRYIDLLAQEFPAKMPSNDDKDVYISEIDNYRENIGSCLNDLEYICELISEKNSYKKLVNNTNIRDRTIDYIERRNTILENLNELGYEDQDTVIQNREQLIEWYRQAKPELRKRYKRLEVDERKLTKSKSMKKGFKKVIKSDIAPIAHLLPDIRLIKNEMDENSFYGDII